MVLLTIVLTIKSFQIIYIFKWEILLKVVKISRFLESV